MKKSEIVERIVGLLNDYKYEESYKDTAYFITNDNKIGESYYDTDCKCHLASSKDPIDIFVAAEEELMNFFGDKKCVEIVKDNRAVNKIDTIWETYEGDPDNEEEMLRWFNS